MAMVEILVKTKNETDWASAAPGRSRAYVFGRQDVKANLHLD
jgi:hypothetical protein